MALLTHLHDAGSNLATRLRNKKAARLANNFSGPRPSDADRTPSMALGVILRYDDLEETLQRKRLLGKDWTKTRSQQPICENGLWKAEHLC